MAERYRRLVEVVEEIAWSESRAYVGRPVEVLVSEGEGRKDAATHRRSGRARDNRLVHLAPGIDARPGDVVTATVTHAAPHHLVADDVLAVRRTRGGDAWSARLEDPVLLRHAIWVGVDTGLPLQFHVGFGDPDVRLHRADPSLLHDFLLATRATGTAIMLLHCYPFHRQAGYLAHVFPHVYMDVGEALNHVGARSAAVLAEALELTPFHKMLYSSDAFGLPELHYLGATGFRRDLATVTGAFVADGAWSAADAERVGHLVGAANARRVYRLDER